MIDGKRKERKRPQEGDREKEIDRERERERETEREREIHREKTVGLLWSTLNKNATRLPCLVKSCQRPAIACWPS